MTEAALHSQSRLAGPLFANLAALTFAAAVPAGKLLLDDVQPLVLAGLLYLGAGLLLTVWLTGVRGARATVLRRGRVGEAVAEDGRAGGVNRRDGLLLVGAVAVGGVLAPVLLLVGLRRTTGSTAGILLSTEVLFTILWAGSLFGEHVARRTWAAAALMCVAGLSLELQAGRDVSFGLGALAVVAACALWALDNNLTGGISTIPSTRVAQLKGLSAGLVNLALGAALGGGLPGAGPAAASLALGGVSYGLSLVLFVVALRSLGAARTGSYFAAAPFYAAALSLIVFGEPLRWGLGVATVCIVAALAVLASERHVHEHRHGELVHSHWHASDPDHRHAHGQSVQHEQGV